MVSVGVRESVGVLKVLGRGQLARYGGGGATSATSQLESEMAWAVGVRHALAVNSGTSALVCALVGAGVGPGDEVLVPAYTWVSTAAAPLAVGAVPVLVEIDESLTIDVADLEAKITPRTKAVLPVHMINLVCDMDPIMEVAERHGITVIEDACQAIGVAYRGRRVGSIGHAGAFSFNQHKNIKAGEGGAVLTNDERLFARASMFHDVGSYERDEQIEVDEPVFIGMNFRMPEVIAAMLRPQFAKLDDLIERRIARRRALVEDLSGRSAFRISPHHNGDEAAGLAIVFDDPDDAASAAEASSIVHRLADSGRHVYVNWQSVVQKRTHHQRLNPHDWIDRTVDYDESTCPATLDVLARSCGVSLPPNIPITVLRRFLRGLPS